tara:strand:+ start:15328 stop:16737 length:1410 start_codon:yes stop_codon:yes gene_type:complete
MAEFQVVVIGAGPGGYLTAIKLAQFGQKVALIENDKLGGECLNYGCIPSKTMINTSDMYHKIGDLSSQGIEVGSVDVDLVKFQAWKNSITSKLRGGISLLCKNYGVEVIVGTARIKNENLVEVINGEEKSEISVDNIIIATGSRANDLEHLKFDGKQIISARDVLDLDHVPKSMLVVGGGAIGLELGTALAKFGTQVTILEITDKLLPGIENDLVNVVERSLNEIGIRVLLNSKITKVSKESDVVVTINNDDEMINESFEKVLVAVGRRANVDNLGLEEIGIKLEDNGFIKVNEQMQTNLSNVFAIGDVIGPPWLAHKAYMQGRKLAYHIAEVPNNIQIKNIPYAVYTEPEIASVGLTEEKALENNHDIRVGKFQFAANARAMTSNENKGFAKVVVENKTEKVLGVHIVSENASELISEGILGLNMGMKIEDIESSIHPHPTQAEALFEAAMSSLDKSVHSFMKKSKKE